MVRIRRESIRRRVFGRRLSFSSSAAQSTPTIRFHPRNDGTAISFKVYRKIITGENRDRTAG
jgi:hypothetical protein